MAERSKAAVLKTVEVKASWGSNPYLPAILSNPKFPFTSKNSHFIYTNFHLMLFRLEFYLVANGSLRRCLYRWETE